MKTLTGIDKIFAIVILAALILWCSQYRCNDSNKTVYADQESSENGTGSEAISSNEEHSIKDTIDYRAPYELINAYKERDRIEQYQPTETTAIVDSTELLYGNWDKISYNTGSVPSCFKSNKLYYSQVSNNKLIINSGNSDVVVKLINLKTKQCIRYVYVRFYSNYSITHIPPGLYYIRLAFGSDWREYKQDGKCKGQFVRDAHYETGEKIMDFRVNYKTTFTLMLDSRLSGNKFQKHNISNEEFNQ